MLISSLTPLAVPSRLFPSGGRLDQSRRGGGDLLLTTGSPPALLQVTLNFIISHVINCSIGKGRQGP